MNKTDYKYASVYNHFKKMIEEGALKQGDRLPSLLKCSKTLSVSKTTVENAYFQLAADGYIISREKSGYYVSGRQKSAISNAWSENKIESSIRQQDASEKEVTSEAIRYDLARLGDDASSFRMDLWQRYLKSAIRDVDRMVTFGDPRGEYDLREAICDYVRKNRDIYCRPENIIVGASTQSLLMQMLPMLKHYGVRNASVPARGFERYAHIFQSHEIPVDIRRKEADIIYVSPSHMTVWGEVMPLSRRYEILEHSGKGHLIIEDDYLNELVFTKQHCPSLYALSGGEHVIYLGSFSHLLLPSIRISFMILPQEMMGEVERFDDLYDQTASKTEQLALCSFIRDDHIYRQIKRLRKVYQLKRGLLKEILESLGKDLPEAEVLSGESGMEMLIRGNESTLAEVMKRMKQLSISCKELSADQAGKTTALLFSCGVIEASALQELKEACELL